MNRVLFVVLLGAFAVFGQQRRVAIVNTVDDGVPPVQHLELSYLTDKMREIAVRVLPAKSFAVMTQQSIVAFLGSYEEAARTCSAAEGCLARLGREIEADFIGQGRIGRFGGNLTIKVELYESKSGNLVSSFTGHSKDVFGLLSLLDKESPSLFKKMLDVSSSRSAPVVRGAGDEGAAVVAAPAVEPERAVSRRAGDGFVFFEVIPFYLDGVGVGEPWVVSINGQRYDVGRFKLSAGEYKVNLSHGCYFDVEKRYVLKAGDVAFERGEFVYDMGANTSVAFDLKVKKGGLDLSAVRDGVPVSVPVFVDGKQVGETPFYGSVAVCSEVRVGAAKELVGVGLKAGEKVKYVYRFGKVSEVKGAGSFKDSRDRKVYKTVKIGSQTWMAENLDYNAKGSRCFSADNCVYGRLYGWVAAMSVCPDGWRLPSDKDWTALVNFAGGSSEAGARLKARDGWILGSNGSDFYGFAALPGGMGVGKDNMHEGNTTGNWWSSTTSVADSALFRFIKSDFNYVYRASANKDFLFSVRCVRGE